LKGEKASKAEAKVKLSKMCASFDVLKDGDYVQHMCLSGKRHARNASKSRDNHFTARKLKTAVLHKSKSDELTSVVNGKRRPMLY